MAHATTRIDVALAAVVAGQLERLAAAWPAALRADADALRRARVATRRMREAIAFARAVEPGVVRKRVARDLRRLGRALGRVREVALARRDLDAAAATYGWPAESLLVVRRRLEREQAAAERRMRRRLASIDLAALAPRLAGLGAIVLAPADARAWRGRLAAAVVRRASRVADARARLGPLYEPERLHALRIALKRLRYIVELLAALTGVPVDALLADLRAHQLQYGRLHDRQVLGDEIRAAAARGSRRASRRLEPILERLDGECRRGHAEAVAALGRVDEVVSAARRAAAAVTHPARRLTPMRLAPQRRTPARRPRRQVG